MHVEATVGMLEPVLGVATAASFVLFVLSFAAFLRRRSWSYLLVALAFAALFSRSLVALLTIEQLLAEELHHTLEHGLDVVMAGLVIAAVWFARTARGEVV